MNQLPPIFSLADLLGLHVEVFIKEQWVAHHNYIIAGDTPIRIQPTHKKQYTRLLEIVSEFFDEVEYCDYTYLVPKSVKTGDIVIFFFGFGRYAQKQEDGTFLDLDFKESHEKYKNVSIAQCYSKKTFFRHN